MLRFTAIGQSDIGEQLRAALIEGYTAVDDDAPGNSSFTLFRHIFIAQFILWMFTAGTSSDYEAEAPTPAAEAETESEAESEALERLARAGHWQRCLAHAGPRAPHYALRYAAHVFKTHPVRQETFDVTTLQLYVRTVFIMKHKIKLSSRYHRELHNLRQ